MRGFYDKLTEIINEHKIQAHQIHNMDESNIDLDLNSKILALKGTEYYQKVVSLGKGHVTLVTCISANGRMMKNLLIFQGKSVPDDIKTHEDILLSASPSGWIDSDSKRSWFKHFFGIFIIKEKI